MKRGRNALAMAVLAVALVEALAIALAFLVPERRGLWLVAGLTMPLLWTAAELLKRDKESLRFAVSGAAMLIALPLAVFAARATGVIGTGDESLGLRLFGIASGLVLVAYGNVVPKRLARYDPDAVDPGRKPALQRYSGWVFVLAGLANALIWALAPIDRAALWSMAPVAAGLALVAAQIAWPRSPRGKAA